MARGHIRRRGDAWEIRAYAGRDPETGRERRITRTVKGTERQAERALTRLLGELDQGAHAGPDATFATLLDRWIEARSPKWSPKTTEEHRGMVRRHIVPTLGKVPVHRVSPSELDRLYARLSSTLSPATVRRIHGVCHSALHQAVKWQWIVSNPATNASPPSVDEPTVTVSATADLKRLLHHIDSHDEELGIFVRLAAYTGARRGELCALRWSDLDLERAEVTISRALVITKGAVIESPRTKTRNRRTIALGPDLVGRLKAYRVGWLEREMQFRRRRSPDFLFLRSDSVSPWRPDSATRRFARHRDALGIGGRLHDLRHGVATLLLSEGVDPVTVAGRLGHANPSTTLKVYGHAQPAPDRRAAELLEERLS